MALTKLIIPPDQAGYAVRKGEEVVAIQLAGGAPRYRRIQNGATSLVNVQWHGNPPKYKYLNAFFNSVTLMGSLPFLIDLILDQSELTEHTAYFVPKTFGLSEQRGLLYVVQAQLDVYPIIPNYDEDVDYVSMYNEFGENWNALDELDTLTNITLPGDLPAPGDTGSLPE